MKKSIFLALFSLFSCLENREVNGVNKKVNEAEIEIAYSISGIFELNAPFEEKVRLINAILSNKSNKQIENAFFYSIPEYEGGNIIHVFIKSLTNRYNGDSLAFDVEGSANVIGRPVIHILEMARLTGIHGEREEDANEAIEKKLALEKIFNFQSFSESTPLHRAVMNLSKRGVSFLLKMGADKNIKNKLGKRPLDYLPTLFTTLSNEQDREILRDINFLLATSGTTHYGTQIFSEQFIHFIKSYEGFKWFNGGIISNEQLDKLAILSSADKNIEVFSFLLEEYFKTMELSQKIDFKTESLVESFEMFPNEIGRVGLYFLLSVRCGNMDGIRKIRGIMERDEDIREVGNFAIAIASNEQNLELTRYILGSFNIDPEYGYLASIIHQMNGNENFIQEGFENTDGNGYIILATKYGSPTFIEYLVNRNELSCNESLDENGETMFTLSCRRGNEKIVTFLFEHLNNVDYRMADEKTPLMLSVEHDKIVSFLLEKEADKDLLDGQGRSPLQLAVNVGNISSVKKLMEGIDQLSEREFKSIIFAINKSNIKCVEYVCEKIEGPIWLDRRGRSILMLASLVKNSGDLIKVLMNKEWVDINGKDLSGMTALMHASSVNNLEVIEVLLENRATNIALTNDGDRTALMIAMEEGHLSAATLLMNEELLGTYRMKEYIDQKDLQGKSAISIACEKGMDSVVVRLMDLGCDINSIDSLKKTPLMLAIENERRLTIDILLAIEARDRIDLDLIDSKGETALIKAIKKDLVLTVDRLIDMGARQLEVKQELTSYARSEEMIRTLQRLEN